jgi:hypothetical protein
MLKPKWRLPLFLMLLGGWNVRYALAILLSFPLTGCVTLTGTKETNGAVCNVWKDVSWSKKDTDQTIQEIKVNNARREGWCGSNK